MSTLANCCLVPIKTNSVCYSIGCNRERSKQSVSHVYLFVTRWSQENRAGLKKIRRVLHPQGEHNLWTLSFLYPEQRESETIDQYLTELRQIAANCDFESITPDQLLRDRLVTGTRNAKVRENLLKEKKLTLEKAVDIIFRAAESTAA